ncbi:Uncharacterized protein TCM_039853 [Theobroma cacao]|uniref:Uncharacterized protein n=1 Tax=Theobroma cacao TaxID=3641 RepID=A0A061GQY9_THECC|nr:Uncharacterized protein TCM_039853 [Theobroma cacao]
MCAMKKVIISEGECILGEDFQCICYVYPFTQCSLKAGDNCIGIQNSATELDNSKYTFGGRGLHNFMATVPNHLKMLQEFRRLMARTVAIDKEIAKK